jgi:hypothetical protein
MGLSERLRQSIVAHIEATGGRHDEVAIYGGAPGDPGSASRRRTATSPSRR